MTKIKIVREPQLIEFESEINLLLSQGYKLHGSPFLAKDNNLYQMLKKINKQKISN